MNRLNCNIFQILVVMIMISVNQGCTQEERRPVSLKDPPDQTVKAAPLTANTSRYPKPLNIVNGIVVPQNAISGHYIVQFAGSDGPDNTRPMAMRAAKSMVNQLVADNNLQTVDVSHTYRAAIKGFAARMSPDEAARLAADPRIKMVAQDQPAVRRSERSTRGSDGNDVFYDIWGLDRIDQVSSSLNQTFSYNYDGTGVHVYVIDEGVFLDHDEWAGRWADGFDAAPAGTCDAEIDGNYGNGYIKGTCGRDHATHVAGTLAGKTFGVASGATLHSVRVWNCCSAPMESNLINGLDWVAANRIDPAVVNFSQGLDGPGPLLDAAVQGLWDSGVFVAVAAGNSGDDACQYAPNSVPGPVLTGAIDEGDNKRSTSNNGPCVDLWAPGGGIHSAGVNRFNNIFMSYRMSGTSMAAPHVAGVAATYLQANPGASPEQTKSAILGGALNGVVSGNLNGAANLLLQSSIASCPAFNCSGDACGQPDGCGGLCPATDASACGKCGNPPCAESNKIHETNLSIGFRESQHWQITGTDAVVHTSGGNGDGDLYVGLNRVPNRNNFDCRSWSNGNTESCQLSGSGTFHILLYGYSTVTGMSLDATVSGMVSEPVCDNNRCEAGEDCASCPADCGSCNGENGGNCNNASYSADDTNSASYSDPQTIQYDITLTAGQTYTISTCGNSNGDTRMRLHFNDIEVAENDDTCGRDAEISYTAESSGTYVLSLGCYRNNTCSATLSVSPDVSDCTVSELCTNSCAYPDDGFCDDGGAGSQYNVCDLGTDCGDCGPRPLQ